ncbi:MAG: tRNA preQ1(34) S-adenosylmethionine ribosyltransferase-isomerase QueA [bacterium]|nr:tRNA preQ1(34) S-adenosylmethionine ribosyltransferase-isomerase QueA [bacterium]
MKKSEFYYDLPEELIAQTPIEPRDSSRLMFLNRASGEVEHLVFSQLGKFLKRGDCLVLNDTRVLPARIFGKRKDTGSIVEFVLLKQRSATEWEAIAGPGKKAKVGCDFYFNNELSATVTSVLDDGNRVLSFQFDGNFFEVLNRIGEMPLPHYITQELKDKERYQTVYSNEPGSAAAPTAGLHFTTEMLDCLSKNGIDIAYVTLHVGLGTFRPVKSDEIENHHMHSEWYHISKESADKINSAKRNGNRVICVGTTSCRTIESAAQSGQLCECSDSTDIFIYPGYKFKYVDGLITNFHLPESTLIMLVSAFAGHENTMAAYKTAVENKYRFFSFGDAMLIL